MRKVMFGIVFPLCLFGLVAWWRAHVRADIRPAQAVWLLGVIYLDGLMLGIGLRAYWREGGHHRHPRKHKRGKNGSLIVVVVPCLIGLFGGAPRAHADYYNYPCTYPFVGSSGDVDVIIHAGGQYCDGPMEINGSHYHCESGGGGVGGGAIGLAPLPGGLNLGGFGGSGVGGGVGRCEWRCPDNTRALPPNPPAAWVKHVVVDDRHNDCRDHMAAAGPDSEPQAPGSGPPGPGQPDVASGGDLPPGPPRPAAAPPVPGKPVVTIPDDPSLLTPGSPIPLP